MKVAAPRASQSFESESMLRLQISCRFGVCLWLPAATAAAVKDATALGGTRVGHGLARDVHSRAVAPATQKGFLLVCALSACTSCAGWMDRAHVPGHAPLWLKCMLGAWELSRTGFLFQFPPISPFGDFLHFPPYFNIKYDRPCRRGMGMSWKRSRVPTSWIWPRTADARWRRLANQGGWARTPRKLRCSATAVRL